MAKRFLLLGFILVLLLAIPITIFVLQSQNATQTNIHAAAASTLSFAPPSDPVTVSVPFDVGVWVDPTSGGTVTTGNSVSFAKVIFTYDGTKLKMNSFNLVGSLTALQGPTFDSGCNTNKCTLTVTVSVGANPQNAITQKTQLATANFTPLAPTDVNKPTTLDWDKTQTQVLSVATSDQAAENVFVVNSPSGQITIAGAPVSDTPTATDTPAAGAATDTPTPGSGSGGSGSGGSGGSGTTTGGPTCSTLTVDKTSGTSPLTVLITANGTSTASATISKVSFNFGDGQVQNVTTGGGIGTSSTNAQVSHIYSSNGTFTATAVLTDSNGDQSNPTSCSQTITVGATTGGSGTPAATPTLAATGPGNTIVGIGVAGVVLLLAGGLLFFAL